MEKVRRIVLIQQDLYEQIRAIAQREPRCAALSGDYGASAGKSTGLPCTSN